MSRWPPPWAADYYAWPPSRELSRRQKLLSYIYFPCTNPHSLNIKIGEFAIIFWFDRIVFETHIYCRNLLGSPWAQRTRARSRQQPLRRLVEWWASWSCCCCIHWASCRYFISGLWIIVSLRILILNHFYWRNFILKPYTLLLILIFVNVLWKELEWIVQHVRHDLRGGQHDLHDAGNVQAFHLGLALWDSEKYFMS